MIDHYEDIRRTYDDFLKNSNMLDLIDVYKKCSVLNSSCENNAIISPVSIFKSILDENMARFIFILNSGVSVYSNMIMLCFSDHVRKWKI